MYLLPKPREIKVLEDVYVLTYDTRIQLGVDFNGLHFAKLLKERIEKILSFQLDIVRTAYVGDKISLSINRELSKQEYDLIIQKDGIFITGGDEEGLLYGVQTLSQIIAQKGATLPWLHIKDYPAIKNRGFYYDVTRGRIPTLASLKVLADKLSYYKLNQLQLYVEHSFFFQDFSEVWRDDTPLMPEEIIELDEYCQKLNIELIPSIASFGHLYKILSTKTYEHLCELEGANKAEFSFVGRMDHHTVDVTNEESFTMITKMLSEYMVLFSSKQFNICSDETFDLGKGKSKELANAIGTNQVYVEFLSKICNFVIEKGLTPMFWGDIILESPETVKTLPPQAICLNWDYNPEVTEDKVKTFHDLGVKQYVCPGVQGWKRLINHLDYAYKNISSMCKYGHQFNVLGVLNTDWGDYGHFNHPEFSTVGMIYGAAFSWSKSTIPFEEINRQISQIEYSDQSEQFASIVTELEKKELFLWESVVEVKEGIEKSNLDKVEYILNQFKDEAVPKTNIDISKDLTNLYKIMNDMDSSKRGLVRPYLIMGKGIQLFNQIGVFVKKMCTTGNISTSLTKNQRYELAEKLEHWFKDYKELWRSYGKEAELYRITQVIVWYGDLLRSFPIAEVEKDTKVEDAALNILDKHQKVFEELSR
ncbi:MAG: hypothetical protein K0S61_240 [Anaerocolumna sp.]|jgi:hypothetical protein|nr:hypothetical protein [Anaerocolumna sp.]